jgi:hypothetical protein
MQNENPQFQMHQRFHILKPHASVKLCKTKAPIPKTPELSYFKASSFGYAKWKPHSKAPKISYFKASSFGYAK